MVWSHWILPRHSNSVSKMSISQQISQSQWSKYSTWPHKSRMIRCLKTNRLKDLHLYNRIKRIALRLAAPTMRVDCVHRRSKDSINSFGMSTWTISVIRKVRPSSRDKENMEHRSEKLSHCWACGKLNPNSLIKISATKWVEELRPFKILI